MIPVARTKKYFSLPAVGFILACLLLAGALAFSTWRNLDREEQLVENFLLQEGLTLIRSFEAGARTSMMMESRSGNLATLVRETTREENVAYIVILDEHKKLIAAAGKRSDATEFPAVSQVLAAKTPLTRFTRDSSGKATFEVAKEFSSLNALPTGMGMMSRWRNWCGVPGNSEDQSCRLVIYLGLYTAEFDAVRADDVHQSLILMGVLFLLGSGGLYFLFLAHKSQVTRVALENMELYTGNVIDSMPAGLLTIDTERRIVSANSKALDLFGCAEADMQGKTLQQLTGTENCSLAPLLREGQEFIDQPLECLRRDGESIPLKVSSSHLRDRDGGLRGMVLILRDQREIRAMEEALERARRHAALGRMAAGIAHEIRNPLGTLKGFAQYFTRSGGSDPQAQEYAELMIGEVDRLNRTVSALLQFARPREPEWVAVDLGALLKKAMTFIQADADNHQVKLNLTLPDGGLIVSADPDLLLQLLLNLLQNSLAAIAAGDQIELGVGPQGDNIRIWIRDTGKGMTATEQSQMFDPFFTTRKEGTGLGLAVVQQIVEQHKGRIEVESTEGQGTRISVILPQRGSDHDQSR